MSFRKLLATGAVLALLPLAALAADISGTWTTSFESQVGVQTYTYTFVVKGSQVTGTFKSANGEGAITDGKLEGDKLTFVENMSYQGQALKIAYTGTVVSADEIKFSRDVGGQGGESFTAKRAK
jgi:predicted aconitase with swiveling domain